MKNGILTLFSYSTCVYVLLTLAGTVHAADIVSSIQLPVYSDRADSKTFTYSYLSKKGGSEAPRPRSVVLMGTLGRAFQDPYEPILKQWARVWKNLDPQVRASLASPNPQAGHMPLQENLADCAVPLWNVFLNPQLNLPQLNLNVAVSKCRSMTSIFDAENRQNGRKELP